MIRIEPIIQGGPASGGMGNFDVIVIGGGAAGMFSSAIAAGRGARVLLLERNDRLGKKLSITGKGRCNLTNDCTVGQVIENIPNDGRFLYSSLSGFTPGDTMEMFRSLGLPLKKERGGRVFPSSDKATDVVEALRRHTIESGVTIRRCRVSGLIAEDGYITGVSAPDLRIGCNAVILATGGMSYPATGSSGDGYVMAGSLGHTVTPLRGSLVPLVAEPETCAKMQGLSLRNVSVRVYDGSGRPIFSDFGELLFTHFGLSGPLALSASAHMRDFENKKYTVSVDLKPALDEKKLDQRIIRDFEKYSNRDFQNSLGDLLARLMIPVVIDRSGIPPDIKTHSVSREQRRRLVAVLKDFHIVVDGLRPVEEAIITSGGLALSQINPKTMESKLISGLFFAGEIIDADAYTGGYNLQIAWSTAYAAGNAAGNAAARRVERNRQTYGT